MTKAFSNRLPVILTAALLLGGGVFAVSAEASEWATFEEADQVYHKAIREGVSIEDRVAAITADTDSSAPKRAQRLHLASLLQWRHGDRVAALSSVDEALAIDRQGALLHQRGRLLEALSRTAEAIDAYREALPLLSGSTRADTELRMALLIASEQGEIEPLLTLAEGGDAAVQNRVAMVLAVLGHPEEATRLYRLPTGASVERQWRHALRLTEWGLWAGESVRAQEAAWRAVDLAQNEQDRLYALALLTETYRQADVLPALVEALESGRGVGGDDRALRVSLLREIDRPEAALALLDSVEDEPAAVKRQFLGIYRESGRSAEMVAELERLMTVDPDEVIWAQGLAEFYLERGERSEAEAAWRGFVERAETAAALLDGAAVILKLGFDELALAAAEKAQRRTVLNRAGRDAALDPAARFQFELYLERGRWDEAREVLQSLEAATAASDPMRQTIAMAYERLNLPAEALRMMQALVEARDSADSETSQYLAQLLIVNGKPQQAVDLLLAALPVAEPSQLRLLHTRLIAAAQMGGIEDELVADLTAKLDDGRATELEAELLIAMRIRAGDETEAVALIDTLYGDVVPKLRQMATLHRELGNWQAYDDTLAELTEQDVDNAVFHIRSRIINYIDSLRFEAEDEQEVSDTLIALLEQYLAVSAVGADREFVAGVLAMGGQRQQAIRMYREIVAVDPSRLDSYLEIGSQLGALQQKPQAVGMYQYLLESSDLEEIAWVALDGILNLQPDRATLEWAQRATLRRLSAAPEQFEYYRQLADLSADLDDNERRLATLYSGLAAEPELRPTTLRELLRSTGGAESLQEWHIAFGRRLLTLGLALPPAVHIELGRAMIEAGDTDAALRAVNQAVEQTGSDELVVQAAGIFRQAGDDLSAHRLFERALRNDPDNLGLLHQTASLNEQIGNMGRAGDLYLQALTTLLTRQPFRTPEVLVFDGQNQPVESLDERELDQVLLDEGREVVSPGGRTVSPQYQFLYRSLRHDLVQTLLGDRQWRDVALSRIQSDYASTLALVRASRSIESGPKQFPPRPAALPRLANHPRLRLQAQLLRYLAYTFGDYATVNELDETLLTLFPEDRLLPEILVSHRAEWGSFAYLDWLENAAALSARQKQVLADHWRTLEVDTDEGLLTVRTTSRSNEPAVYRALDRALRVDDAALTVRAIKQLAETDSVWETLERVEPYLSPTERKTVARHVIALLRNDPDLATDSLRINNIHFIRQSLPHWPRSWAARLEDWSGEAVFDEEQLLALVNVPEGQLAGNPQLGYVDVWFIYHTLSSTGREEWLERLLNGIGAYRFDESIRALALVSLLLQVEQDEATANLLRTLFRLHGQNIRPRYFVLYRADIHPANVPLAKELIARIRRIHSQEFAEWFPDPVYEISFLRSEGKTEEALKKLVDAHFDSKLPAVRDISFIGRHLDQLVAGNESKLIEMVSRRSLSLPEAIKQRNHLLLYLHRRLRDVNPQKLLQVVLDALQTDPENFEFLKLASEIHAWAGETFAAQETRRAYLNRYTDDSPSAAFRKVESHDFRLHELGGALFRSSLELDHPIDAIVYRDVLGYEPAATAAATTMPPPDVEALEARITSMPGHVLEQVQDWFDALAEAHVRNGSAAARFTELSAAIHERRASDKDLRLWLAIGSRVPELAASDEAGAALATYLELETAYRTSILFGLARFLAVRGDTYGALKSFNSLILWVHGGVLAPAANSDVSMPISLVLTAARETLDAKAYERLLRDVLDRVKPSGGYLLPAYSEFVLSQFDAAIDREAFYRAFKSDVDVALQALDAVAVDVLPLMRVAMTQSRLDRGLAALDTLQKAMEVKASIAVGRFAPFPSHLSFMHDAHASQERARSEESLYRKVLGLDRAPALLDERLPELLFSEAGLDWLRLADVTVRDRIEAGDIGRDLGIEMLLSLVRAYDERDAGEDRDGLLIYLKAQLSYAEEITPATAADIFATAEELGQGLNDIRLEKALLSKGAIEPEHMAAVLRRIAASEGDVSALEVGSRLLEFTLNDALMDELIALADGTGRSVQAEEWRVLQREARLARAELDRT